MSDKPTVVWDDEAGPLRPVPSVFPSVEWDEGGPPPPPKPDSFFSPYNPLRFLSEKVSPLLTRGVGLGGRYSPLDALQALGSKIPGSPVPAPSPVMGRTQERSEELAKWIVPQTQTDWALAGAFPGSRALSPLVTKGPTLQRMLSGAGTIAAGGAASAAEQGTPVPGLIQGAIVPVAGALPAAAGYVTKGTQWGKRKVLESMERELAEDMGKISPAFRGLKPGEDMYRKLVVFTQPVRDRFSAMFSSKLDEAALHLAPGNTVTSPRLIEVWKSLPKKDMEDLAAKQALAPISGKFTIYQAQELLDISRKGAYRGQKLALERAAGERVAAKFRAARDEAFASLPPPAAGAWQEARIMHGVNRGLLALFKEGGAMQPGVLGPRLDPNKALVYLEKNAENLSRKFGEDAFFVLHSALSRGGKLGERHETGVKELVPGILERSVVITRSILKHIGVSPTTWGGTRGQPFAPGAGVEAVTGLLAGQAGRRAMPDLEERREFIQ